MKKIYARLVLWLIGPALEHAKCQRSRRWRSCVGTDELGLPVSPEEGP